jgi:hypothetical protein
VLVVLLAFLDVCLGAALPSEAELDSIARSNYESDIERAKAAYAAVIPTAEANEQKAFAIYNKAMQDSNDVLVRRTPLTGGQGWQHANLASDPEISKALNEAYQAERNYRNANAAVRVAKEGAATGRTSYR